MTWVAVVDAWVDDLTTNVSGLTEATVHRYAPWSFEEMFASVGERHLAIWPQAEPEIADGLTTTPADLAVQSYAVTVWESASDEATRLQDDDEANIAWLELHEAIRARFYVSANKRIGDSNIMDTRYRGAAFERAGDKRTMVIRFQVTIPLTYT